jgi:hypothetical protein
MKTLLTLTFIFYSFLTFAQSYQSPTVKIDKVTKSVLYFKGKVIIGTVILEQPPIQNPKLTLNPIEQTKDSTGYTTIFTFNNPKHLNLNDLDLIVSTDKPMISGSFAGGMGHFITESYNDNKTVFEFKAQSWESQTILQIIIKSLEKVRVNIKGLDFAFNQ